MTPIYAVDYKESHGAFSNEHSVIKTQEIVVGKDVAWVAQVQDTLTKQVLPVQDLRLSSTIFASEVDALTAVAALGYIAGEQLGAKPTGKLDKSS